LARASATVHSHQGTGPTIFRVAFPAVPKLDPAVTSRHRNPNFIKHFAKTNSMLQIAFLSTYDFVLSLERRKYHPRSHRLDAKDSSQNILGSQTQRKMRDRGTGTLRILTVVPSAEIL
jgi:hypothetical protein